MIATGMTHTEMSREASREKKAREGAKSTAAAECESGRAVISLTL